VSHTQPESLDLPAVVQRFADAERALGALAQRLGSLDDSATSAAVSSATLAAAAQALEGFTAAAKVVVDQLAEVSANARTALERSAAILDGSGLAAIEQRLATIHQGLLDEGQRTREELAREGAGVDQRLAAIEARLAATEGLVARLDRIEANIAVVFSALPSRWRKGAELSHGPDGVESSNGA
jgi:hypothetical protein